MTWSITVNGHDDLAGEEKAALENFIVKTAKILTDALKDEDGCNVTSANATTNTTGTVNLMEDSS